MPLKTPARPGACPSAPQPQEVRVYRRRWAMLALFVAAIALNALPWMQYTVIGDVATPYYGVTHTMIEWTSMVYNVTAMLLAFPAAWVLDKYVSTTQYATEHHIPASPRDFQCMG